MRNRNMLGTCFLYEYCSRWTDQEHLFFCYNFRLAYKYIIALRKNSISTIFTFIYSYSNTLNMDIIWGPTIINIVIAKMSVTAPIWVICIPLFWISMPLKICAGRSWIDESMRESAYKKSFFLNFFCSRCEKWRNLVSFRFHQRSQNWLMVLAWSVWRHHI